MPNIVSPASKSKSIARDKIFTLRQNFPRLFFLILLIISDQISKYIVTGSLYSGKSLPVIKEVFHITLVYNTGAAFGALAGNNILFALISSAVIIYISVYVISGLKKGRHLSFPLALILAGAVSNLIDRLRFGYVIDFLDFRVWPVFNVADSAITIGAILFGYSILRSKDKS